MLPTSELNCGVFHIYLFHPILTANVLVQVFIMLPELL
jgi:hypothetical protein